MKCILSIFEYFYFVHLIVYRNVIISTVAAIEQQPWLCTTPWLWASIRVTMWASWGTVTAMGASPSTPSLCRTLSERCAALPPMSSKPQNCSRSLKDKKALKFIKQMVGTHIYVKGRREELNNVPVIMRKTASKKDWAPSPDNKICPQKKKEI